MFRWAVKPAAQVDILAMGSPCVDLSALKNNPDDVFGSDGQTASGFAALFRYVRKHHPPIVLLENSDRLYAKLGNNDRKAAIHKVESFAKREGYILAHSIANAAAYGLPQNRPRCYMICVLNTESCVREPASILSTFEGFKCKPLPLKSTRFSEPTRFNMVDRDVGHRGACKEKWKVNFEAEREKLGKARGSKRGLTVTVSQSPSFLFG